MLELSKTKTVVEAPLSETKLDPATHPMRLEAGGCLRIGVDESGRAFGSIAPGFIEGLGYQIAHATLETVDDSRAMSFAAAVVGGIGPKDQIESMLGAQMAAVHLATMKFAATLNRAQTVQQQEVAVRQMNQLARTFVAQVEGIKRYRSNGQQSVSVRHVHVYEGGQAIVGNVTAGGRASEKN